MADFLFRLLGTICIAFTVGCTDDAATDTGSETLTNAYCDSVEVPTAAESDLELAILAEVTRARNTPEKICPELEDPIEQIQTPTRSDSLDCVARAHAQDLQSSGAFTHVSGNGDLLADRLDAAAHDGSTLPSAVPVEFIAKGFDADVQLLFWGASRSPSDCQKLHFQPLDDADEAIAMEVGVGVAGDVVVVVIGGAQ